MNDLKITYLNRVKALVNNDIALQNGIIQGDYKKVNETLTNHPEILSNKHEKLRDAVLAANGNSLTPEQKENHHFIKTDIAHLAEKHYSSDWVNRNQLTTGNHNEDLKNYLSVNEPSFKEPIIHYISNGADIKQLTKEQLDSKLYDVNVKDFGGKKFAEDDKSAVIEFAKNHAIKTDNLEAYKHLEKEFGIAQDIKEGNLSGKLDMLYMKVNESSKILEYSNSLNNKFSYTESQNINLENTVGASNKLNIVEQNQKLKTAIDSKNINGIKDAILNGADVKIINRDNLKHIDPKDQLEVFNAAKEAKLQRNANIDQSAKFENKPDLNKELQKAVINKEATTAFNLIKQGADTKSLTKDDFKNYSSSEKKEMEEAIIKAVNTNTAVSDNKESQSGKLKLG